MSYMRKVCQIDLISIADEIEDKLDMLQKHNVAVMGCAVNGPGRQRKQTWYCWWKGEDYYLKRKLYGRFSR